MTITNTPENSKPKLKLANLDSWKEKGTRVKY